MPASVARRARRELPWGRREDVKRGIRRPCGVEIRAASRFYFWAVEREAPRQLRGGCQPMAAVLDFKQRFVGELKIRYDGQEYPLAQRQTLVGRSRRCVIVLN